MSLSSTPKVSTRNKYRSATHINDVNSSVASFFCQESEGFCCNGAENVGKSPRTHSPKTRRSREWISSPDSTFKMSSPSSPPLAISPKRKAAAGTRKKKAETYKEATEGRSKPPQLGDLAAQQREAEYVLAACRALPSFPARAVRTARGGMRQPTALSADSKALATTTAAVPRASSGKPNTRPPSVYAYNYQYGIHPLHQQCTADTTTKKSYYTATEGEGVWPSSHARAISGGRTQHKKGQASSQKRATTEISAEGVPAAFNRRNSVIEQYASAISAASSLPSQNQDGATNLHEDSDGESSDEYSFTRNGIKAPLRSLSAEAGRALRLRSAPTYNAAAYKRIANAGNAPITALAISIGTGAATPSGDPKGNALYNYLATYRMGAASARLESSIREGSPAGPAKSVHFADHPAPAAATVASTGATVPPAEAAAAAASTTTTTMAATLPPATEVTVPQATTAAPTAALPPVTSQTAPIQPTAAILTDSPSEVAGAPKRKSPGTLDGGILAAAIAGASARHLPSPPLHRTDSLESVVGSATLEEAELKLIRDLHTATSAVSDPNSKAMDRLGAHGGALYGWRQPPSHVLLPDEQGEWRVLGPHTEQQAEQQQRYMEQHQTRAEEPAYSRGVRACSAGAASKIAEDRLVNTAVAGTVIGGKATTTGAELDYQACFQDVLHPESIEQALYASDVYLNANHHNSRSTADAKKRSATLASQSVLLRDPLSLLSCQYLDADTRVGKESLISAAGVSLRDATSSSFVAAAAAATSALGSTLRAAPPPGEIFCKLSYSAKILLSSVLYVRALGGFPTLLRAQPLTDLSPIVDKENCIELVFWNPRDDTPQESQHPQQEAINPRFPLDMANMSLTHNNALGAAPSNIEKRLSQTLSAALGNSVAGRQPGDTSHGLYGSANASLARGGGGGPDDRRSSLSRAELPQQHSLGRQPMSRRGSHLGSERASSQAVPRVSPPFHGHLRRSSSVKSVAGSEDGDNEKAAADGTAPSVGLGGPFATAVAEVIRRKQQGSRRNSLWSAASSTDEGAAAHSLREPPSTPTKKGHNLIEEGDDELCVVVRAVLAQKSTVYCFGKEEIVHVLPPLPSEENVIEQRTIVDSELERLALRDSDPVFKLLQNTGGEAEKLIAKRRVEEIARKRRVAARGPVVINEDGTPSAEDYGDLLVAYLLSGEASQMSGALPDAMELESLRYRIFTLQGYSVKDPYGINNNKNVVNKWAAAMSADVLKQQPTLTDERYSMASRSAGATPTAGGRRRSTFSEDLFARYGYRQENPTASSSAEQQLKAKRKAEEAAMAERLSKQATRFPLYRASSVGESTLAAYHAQERNKARQKQLKQAAIIADVRWEDENDQRLAAGSARDEDGLLTAKNNTLREAEKDLLKFRPMNLNGFYGELLEATQFALDVQVRQTKERVMQAFHM